ncbi:nitrophenyl compound nitroreductase subunit ArsF family protein [Bacteroidales bacterium OttesenSCG-928-C03]|nr:nitrophenyl compound nitroreductase subunit ArsF family protein [Bacteroidales bacterium OttesenSCG-928-C03]MDL2326337.1 nitrophenyl compound nitroreductase subunit ArsF family protein [Bacteroidales bacterium OttesenSCG-928-A14]
MMKNLIISILACLMFASCGNGNQEKPVAEVDISTVYVYYFHGKQRCKTCVAVENITQQTIAENFGGNDNVKYIEVKTDETENESLIEKYEIGWNALIIAKGDEYVDITNDAFATAVKYPEKLRTLIKQTVDAIKE